MSKHHSGAVRNRTVGQKLSRRRLIRRNIPLYAMFLPVIAFYLLFKYMPMTGLQIAFKKYTFAKGIWGSPWNGWDNFKLIFNVPNTVNIIWNTLHLSLLRIVFGFPAPIILALLLNEMRNERYKKSMQTILYIPHFFSWVIVGTMVMTIFSQENGIINTLIKQVSGQPYPFMYKPTSWIVIFTASGVWKEMGYGTIVYMAALTGIDPTYYEAAVLDGANKWHQIRDVTLPMLRPTIVTLLILQVGHVLEVGFDQVYVLKNDVVNNVADVISTYVYRMGIEGARFSLATAMGLFESVVGLILVVSTNAISKRLGDEGLF